MANYWYLLGSSNNQPPGGWGYMKYIIADVDAAKPVTNLHTGDLCWATDTELFYVADSATSWSQVSRYNLNGTTFSEDVGFIDSIRLVSGGGGPESSLSWGDSAARGRTLDNISGALCHVSNGTEPPSAGYMSLVNQTAKVAAIVSTNLTNTTPAGVYEITYYLRCTTADVTAGTIQFSATYTDSVGATTDSSAVVALTSTANRAQGVIVADLASGNITYSTTLVGIAGTSQYKLRVRCKFLG